MRRVVMPPSLARTSGRPPEIGEALPSGTRRGERLEENLGAADLGLSAQDVVPLDDASLRIQLVGKHFPEAMQRMIDR